MHIKNKIRVYCFDIDGVVCNTKKITTEAQSLLKKQLKRLMQYILGVIG